MELRRCAAWSPEENEARLVRMPRPVQSGGARETDAALCAKAEDARFETRRLAAKKKRILLEAGARPHPDAADGSIDAFGGTVLDDNPRKPGAIVEAEAEQAVRK